MWGDTEDGSASCINAADGATSGFMRGCLAK
jgi:hypothetical protein